MVTEIIGKSQTANQIRAFILKAAALDYSVLLSELFSHRPGSPKRLPPLFHIGEREKDDKKFMRILNMRGLVNRAIHLLGSSHPSKT